MTLSIANVDQLRFIDNLHTTGRQIIVFTAIIDALNNKSLPKTVLEKLLITWSLSEEASNIKYKLSKGKITNSEGKPTSALRYHIELSSSLGLTKRFNATYSNTKIAQTFISFLNFKKLSPNYKELSTKIFFLFQLLVLDADAILLLLSELKTDIKTKQVDLQRRFKKAFNERLNAKIEIAKGNSKASISSRYRAINFIWKRPEKYAEHIIAPRYEWMAFLGLVSVYRDKGSTWYSLTESGEMFYHSLPRLINNDYQVDINYEWISNSIFDSFKGIYDNDNRIEYKQLTEEKQDEYLGDSLEKTKLVVKSSISFKLPLNETFFFLCLDSFINKGIVLNFADIGRKLEGGFVYHNKLYLLKTSGRLNEGYITITTC